MSKRRPRDLASRVSDDAIKNQILLLRQELADAQDAGTRRGKEIALEILEKEAERREE